MIHYHPSVQALDAHVRHELPVTESTIIAAHLDLCRECKAYCDRQQQQEADQWFQDESVPLSGSDDMLAAIFAAPPAPTQPSSQPLPELQGHTFKLPPTLQRLADQASTWRRIVGGLWRCNVELEPDVRCSFLYMAPGGRIPEHTHQGQEMTLVLEGSFRDERGDYDVGDYLALDPRDKHTPISDEGCLCFTVVTHPLVFTSGLARLLNPFSKRFF